jgi:hypothetical protein
MRIYWDQVLAGHHRSTPVRLTRVGPAAANLEWRGFSAAVTPDGREPFVYDYTRVTATAPWKTPAGAYTREGDVGPLLLGADDLFVISMPGDQLAVSWDASAFPPLAPDQTRTLLLYAVGYSKEMNARSASPDRVEPLPFHGMTKYPYDASDAAPSTHTHQAYLAHYQTRVVKKSVPPLERHIQREIPRR